MKGILPTLSAAETRVWVAPMPPNSEGHTAEAFASALNQFLLFQPLALLQT